jgi:Asp-tRNA(Asn)/Glu-tRNA(Gln) amidotransferase A subunit family amidase
MSDDNLSFLSVAELSTLIARRKVSPVEVVCTTLARIERSQRSLS